MSNSYARILFTFLIPGGLVVFIAFLLTEIRLAEVFSGFFPIYALLVLGGGILLGLRAKSSQLILTLVVLFFADRGLSIFFNNGMRSGESGECLFNILSFLLPLNIVYLSRLKERGFNTKNILPRLIILSFQILSILMICNYPQIGIGTYLKHSFFELLIPKNFPLTHPVIFVFIISGLFLLFRAFKTKSVIDIGFFWALISTYLCMTKVKIGPEFTIYLSTAGLILVIAFAESSFGRAYLDELTGLPGRRAFNEALAKLGKNFTIAMVDIDHFKRFNDRYGHQTGDEVLRMIASRLSDVSGGGSAFRYGGEEFALIFPETSRKESLPLLERLRKDIQAAGFVLRCGERRTGRGKNGKSTSRKLSLTVSIGTAQRNQRYPSPKQVVKAADVALYRAKKKGRNRVSI